ncbi:type 1 glutamine amidotransferase [Salaquimonas pukyongi]|uniref:type 1 glutamine amidotransferase n=1 Tax=Salaquimonas pukyongi TaxID=2712698 RepID=UPI00096BC0B8|nr:type 1 glutamine amidotransferase [Salaquimonas pukyongi]
MKIGILQTGHVPEDLVKQHGEYPAMFERMLSGHGFTFETWAVVDNELPDSIYSADAWLITGSRHGAYEDHAFIPPLEAFIRKAYAAEVPLAGICFGHQILAQALGGKVVKFPGGWGLGQTVYKMGEEEIELLALHQDQVVEKPEAAEVIASTDFCANAGLAYPGANGIKAISFQPHPEFSTQYLRDLIVTRSGVAFPEEQGNAALSSVKEKNDSDKIAQQLADFFLKARASQAA